jgi:hypothetical protein
LSVQRKGMMSTITLQATWVSCDGIIWLCVLAHNPFLGSDPFKYKPWASKRKVKPPEFDLDFAG